LLEHELGELFHKGPQSSLLHGWKQVVMQAALAEQGVCPPLGGAGFEMLIESESLAGGAEHRQQGDREGIEQPQAIAPLRHIGYVAQLLSADSSFTAAENMLVSARLYGIPVHERKQRIDRALAAMGLSEAADRLVSGYSGGMIRRLEIAQSMLHRPTVLFMDEPTVGLDPSARDPLWQHVLALQSEFHATMLITSHYLEGWKNCAIKSR
jgi:ABC-type Mn2+/Zn2+ transport system ATPase subunit